MDTFILVLSAAVVFTIGYGVVWTVRAVRRVGVRRFARALGALMWAVLVAIIKLVLPGEKTPRETLSDEPDDFDLLNSIRNAEDTERLTREGALLHSPFFDESDDSHESSAV